MAAACGSKINAIGMACKAKLSKAELSQALGPEVCHPITGVVWLLTGRAGWVLTRVRGLTCKARLGCPRRYDHLMHCVCLVSLWVQDQPRTPKNFACCHFSCCPVTNTIASKTVTVQLEQPVTKTLLTGCSSRHPRGSMAGRH